MPTKMEGPRTATEEEGNPVKQRFVELRKLGQGTYGKVQLALNRATNEEVAIKTIKKARVSSDKAMKRIQREIQIMSSIRHPHIIHIQEVFETRQQIIIVMQYASGGELYDYLVSHEVLPDDEARRIFRQIVCAVYHCHKNKICHRDLKLENILLDSEGNAQIADFGLSNTFEDDQTMSTSCGSPHYASPEIVSGMAYKGPEVDCWSLGVLLYNLVYGTMPFNGRSFHRLVMQIIEGRYKEPENKSSASSLIRRLLTPDASKRATIEDVCKDPWMDEGYSDSFLDLAEKMAALADQQKVPPQRLESSLLREQSDTLKPKTRQVTKDPIADHVKSENNSSVNDRAVRTLKSITKHVPRDPIADHVKQENNSSFNDQAVKTLHSISKHALQDPVADDKDENNSGVNDQAVGKSTNRLIENVGKVGLRESATKMAKARVWNMKKSEKELEKVDSAVVIPIFDVTSTMPDSNGQHTEAARIERNKSPAAVRYNSEKSQSGGTAVAPNSLLSNENEKEYIAQKESSSPTVDCRILERSTELSEPSLRKKTKKKKKQENLQSSSGKSRIETNLNAEAQGQTKDKDASPKRPTFLRTKHHVMNLACLLSMNYEKLKQSAMKVSVSRKKPPGKLTIPQTFTSPRPRNPCPERRESVVIPTVSVSESKQKIQKKIEKIRRAALDKSLVIRSDTSMRLRIENFLRSQVRQLQDLQLRQLRADEQGSRRASLENLDERSFQTTYYRSENADSGIVSTEDDDYFCFLCSKATSCDVASAFVSSATLDSIRRDSLYTSSHLHIPSQRRSYDWRQLAANNAEFGGLTRCRSEIHLPAEYLSYISPNKSGLNAGTSSRVTKDDLAQYFYSKPSLAKLFHPTSFVLRSASDSVGLSINSAIEVIKLNSEKLFQSPPKAKATSHFLKHVKNPSSCGELQSPEAGVASQTGKPCYKDLAKNIANLVKDEGIGNSNDSFQNCTKSHWLHVSLGSELGLAAGADENAFTRSVSESCLPQQQNFNSMETQKGCKRSISASSLDILVQICEASLLETRKKGTLGNRSLLRRSHTVPCVRNEAQCSQEAKTEYIKSKIGTIIEDINRNALTRSFLNQCSKSSGYAEWVNNSIGQTSLFNAESLPGISDSENLNYQQLRDFVRTSDLHDKSTSYFENLLMQLVNLEESRVSHSKHLSRARTFAGELDSESVISLKGGRRCSEVSSSNRAFESSEYDSTGQRSKRKGSSKKFLPRTKAQKPKPKKSFLQLLALKRIREAEKELENARKVKVEEEENSGSLLEALKTQGYKSVISQRLQSADDDFHDPYFARRIKTAEQLRAEVARLNYTNYESLPDYGLDQYSIPDHTFCDYNNANDTSMSLLYNSLYNISSAPRQTIPDWLNTIQLDDYPNTADYTSTYVSTLEDIAPPIIKRKSRKKCYRNSFLEDYGSMGTRSQLSKSARIYESSDRYTSKDKETEKRQSSFENDFSDRYSHRRKSNLETQSSFDDFSSRHASKQKSKLETRSSLDNDFAGRYASRSQTNLETQSSLDNDYLSGRLASRSQTNLETQSSLDNEIADRYTIRGKAKLDPPSSLDNDIADRYTSRRQAKLDPQSSLDNDIADRYTSRRQAKIDTQSSLDNDIADRFTSRRQAKIDTQSSLDNDIADRYTSRRQAKLDTQSSLDNDDFSDRYASMRRQSNLDTHSSSENFSNRSQCRRQASLETQSSSEQDYQHRYHSRRQESLETQSSLDDEKESVQDRIWRKSFYSRFNDRALSRRRKSSFTDSDVFSDSCLGMVKGKKGVSTDERDDGYATLKSVKRKKSFCQLR